MRNYIRHYHTIKSPTCLQLCAMTTHLWQSIHIGKLLRQYAEREGISQVRLAQMVNVANKSIFNIYSKPNINTDMLRRIGHALNVNFFEVIYKEEKKLNADLYGDNETNNQAMAAEAPAEYVAPREKSSVFAVIEIVDGQMVMKSVENSRSQAEQKVSRLKDE